MNPDAYGMLGILNRAGFIRFGEGMEKGFRKGYLLLLAKDASPRILKTFEEAAKANSLPIYYANTKQELGAPLGRDALTAVLVTSQKGASSLLKKLQKGETS